LYVTLRGVGRMSAIGTKRTRRRLCFWSSCGFTSASVPGREIGC
jgi:hypothetical protein